MNRYCRLLAAILSVALLAVPLASRAAGYLWLPLFHSGDSIYDNLEYLGLQRLSLPSLTPSGLITGMPAPDQAFATADGRTVGLYRFSYPGLWLYDTHTLQLRRHIEGFNRPSIGCFGRDVVQHPTRPEVLIFCGGWWFDTVAERLVETPTTLGFHTSSQGPLSTAVTVSAGRRFLIVTDCHPGLNFCTGEVRVIDFAAPRQSREFPAITGSAMIAFDERVLVVRSTPASGMRLIDLDTGTDQGRVAEPAGTVFTGYAVAGPGGSVLLEGYTTGIQGPTLWQIDQPHGTAHQVASFGTEGPPYLRNYEVAGDLLLKYYLTTQPGCIIFQPLGCAAGPMRVTALNLRNGASTHFSLADGTLPLPGPLYSPGAEPIVVPAQSRGAVFVMLSLLLSAGLWRLGRPRAKVHA